MNPRSSDPVDSAGWRYGAPRRSSPWRDPRRRSRNFGTAKRGYGQDNRQVIPQPHAYGDRSFFHALKAPVRCSRTIRERTVGFFVEPPTRDCRYACTVDDVARLLSEVPLDDWAGIYFRRPLAERERAAHRYAMTLKMELERRGTVRTTVSGTPPPCVPMAWIPAGSAN